MLYIQFKISDSEKFNDFQKLYQHLVTVRTPGFNFDVDMEAIDWTTITPEEEELLFDEELQQEKRYRDLLPAYAQTFIDRYLQFDTERLGPIGAEEVISIMNYLEYDFEVEMDQLEKQNENLGLVQFSTGNYPFGGMERFLMVLRAFDLIPTECYDGFTIYECDWTSEFEHNAIELPEKTKEYLKN